MQYFRKFRQVGRNEKALKFRLEPPNLSEVTPLDGRVSDLESTLYYLSQNFVCPRAAFTIFINIEQSPTFADLTAGVSATLEINKKMTWTSVRISTGHF